MRAVSPKRAKLLRIYGKSRKEFLAEHPMCEFPLGCTARATTIQHRRGRFGLRLLDQTYWAASCWAHNQWAEDATGAALACGWLLPIEAA